MKIAHLSDFHLNRQNRPDNYFYTRHLIEYALGQNIDHLVITGDLTHQSTSQDFDDLRQLLKHYGLLDSGRVSLVIGNHDIFGGVHLAEDLLTFPKQAAKINYQKKLQEFRYYFLEIFDNTYQPLTGNLFPYAKFLDNFVFIGLNSIARYSKIKNLFASRGKLDKFQQQGIKKIFNHPAARNKFKIVLIHHHFGITEKKGKSNLLENLENHSMKLTKKKKIVQLFKDHGVKLVLHGHTHESISYHKKGILFMNAGGSVENNQRHYLHLNLIDIHDEQVAIEVRKIPRNTFNSNKNFHHLFAFSS